MNMRPTMTLLGVASASAVLAIVAGPSDAGKPSSPVEVSVAPDQLAVTAGLPCLPAPPLDVAMTNTSEEAVYGDAFVRPDAPLTTTRQMLSSYLPAGATVSVPVTVTAPYGAEPGDYEVTVEVAQEEPGGQAVDVPVEVSAPPEKTRGTNLLLGEQATPSSTYVTSSTTFNPCGGVDGDRTWSHPTAWSSANRGDFPATYTVALPEPQTMNRVDLYTSTSPDRVGLRDWDVLVKTGGQWQTVAQVRGNVERYATSTFDAVEASAVRIVGLAANDDAYARIAEVEAYYDGPVSMALRASPSFVLYPGGASQVQADLTNLTDSPENGSVSLDVPEGWTVEPAEQPYELDPGEQGSATFTVTSAADAAYSTEYEVMANLSPDGGETALYLPVRDGILYTQDGEPWYTETGGWSASSLTGHGGTLSRYSHDAEGGSGATATWTPQLPHPGTYRVHVWYPTNPTTTTAASYTVTHAGGATELVVNQQENADTWNLLGTWEFEAGDAGSVTLTSAATGHHRANAVWFEPVAG